MSALPVLEARRIIKRFNGITALNGVSFAVAANEVHALCGENGAGKSTLIKVLSGVHPEGSYEGEILIDGRRAGFRSTRDAESAGIAIIHQELALFPEMTVAENLALGNFPCRGGRIDWDRVYCNAAAILAECGIRLDPAAPVGQLGVGQQQLVEIARAVARRPRILVLDEPTAALSQGETDGLLELIRRLRTQGVAAILISHKLDEVRAVADRITVLRDGAAQGTVTVAQADTTEIIRRMVGRPLAELYPSRSVAFGRTMLRVEGLRASQQSGRGLQLHDIDLEVRAGEVLGIGGLMGAGRSELLMHLFGAWGVRHAGVVELDGRVLAQRGPREALRNGLALVTEDRKRYGLFAGQGVVFNLSLSSLEKMQRRGFVDGALELAQVRSALGQFDVRVSSPQQQTGTLSGGNQQKVVLARNLLTGPKVLLLDEPTRGIDVGARREIYEIINRLTAAGTAVVLVSSELGELLGMSDRIAMLREGTVTAVLERRDATPERLLAAAMGALAHVA